MLLSCKLYLHLIFSRWGSVEKSNRTIFIIYLFTIVIPRGVPGWGAEKGISENSVGRGDSKQKIKQETQADASQNRNIKSNVSSGRFIVEAEGKKAEWGWQTEGAEPANAWAINCAVLCWVTPFWINGLRRLWFYIELLRWYISLSSSWWTVNDSKATWPERYKVFADAGMGNTWRSGG